MIGFPDSSQRLKLAQRLSALPGPQLDQVIFTLNPAKGNIPPASAPPADRVMALLTWAESEIGCGLETLQKVLGSVLAQSEDAAPPLSQGKRVFISYRSQEPDVSLAQAFHDQLQAAGHEPFMAAESINWGENWVNRIDQELKRCDYFLLLLSERSATSDMVAGEVRTARRLRDHLGKPVILPVRVNLPLDDPLNYELRSVLQTIQQKSWQGPEDTAALVQDFLALIEAGEAPAPVKEKDEPEITPSLHQRPPLPVADLELPSGTMPLDSKFYIRREPWDTRCLQEIENRGGLVRVKAPRQMGKTSLLARIRDRATELGYQTVTVDFLETDERTFTDSSLFLKRLCALVSRKLGFSPRQVTEFWDEELFGPKENCTDFFEEHILSKIDTSLFLGLDELDRLFPYEAVSKEFLTLLRSWNEKAKVDKTWAKFKLAIAHSTESYVVLESNVSPFNVGLAVELPEFTSAQVMNLVGKHGLNWSEADVGSLMAMVGGHPYLIRLALYHVAQQDLTLAQLLQAAPTDAGIFGEHLRRHLWNLQQHPELAKAFEQVIMSEKPVTLKSMLAFKLNGMGLVNFQSNDVVLRHKSLYRPYFHSRLRMTL
ncbi:AAA-like domain-containing protein [Leptolyngbya sp. CCNP1308]|uniref:AAA-like domain-containing protein n=1 Tax=Leptolyngbya sp. CCNP1308 TaxID=3110255 RepID=UPI002B1FB6A2|nr:AAA-like domain-containing protein [Leptolyngbya sp. CCNP1308]MEA5448363.1 AAA-like domain-containing protein [Leptolyngbya sp. CCNP1308]